MGALFDRSGVPREPNGSINGKPVYRYVAACHRCGGAGGHEMWRHTGWTCYECGGSGRGASKAARLYDEAQLAKLDARLQARRAKAAAEREAEAAKLAAERAARRDEWVAANADVLAQLDICVEEERMANMLAASELAKRQDRDPHACGRAPSSFWADFRRDIVERANELSGRQIEVIDAGVAKARAAQAARAGRHVGKVGGRLRKISAEVIRSKHVCTVSRFPLIERYLVVFRLEDGSELTWWAGHGERLGACVISCSVKAHEEYMGKPQTIVQRVAFHDDIPY